MSQATALTTDFRNTWPSPVFPYDECRFSVPHEGYEGKLAGKRSATKGVNQCPDNQRIKSTW